MAPAIQSPLPAPLESAPPALPPPPSGAPESAAHATTGQKVWTFLRILNVRLRFILLMVIVGVVVGKWETIVNYYDRWTRPAHAGDQVTSEAVEYFCGMHPNIVRDTPGKCPICGMPLSKRARTAGRHEALPEGVLAQVQLTPLKVRMGRIGTSPVEYRLLTREVRAVGIVDYDETHRAYISSRLKGRIDKLLVNYVGQKVHKGDPLVEIYSPDLLVAQEELLTAAKGLAEQKDATSPAALAAKVLFDAARKKLLLWGLTEAQVDEIAQRGQAQTHVTIYSPISGIVTEKRVLEGHYAMEGEDLFVVADLGRVWLQAKIFESDITGIDEGQAVEVASAAYPHEGFVGRITFIAYTVDADTRTISARIEIANPEYKLKPGMYVTAAIRRPMGHVSEATPTTQPEVPKLDTRPLAQAYLKLAAAYAADKTDDAAASELAQQAEALAGQAPGVAAAGELAGHAKHVAGQPLEAQREMFKAVSTAAITLLRIAPAPGMTLFIAHCPMVKADWISDKKEILNPYAGADMLTCGSITGPLEPEAVGAGGSGGPRFVTGYFCPLYPDRLYAKPEACPLDQVPLQYARIEKVLAVPESAVIDTGTPQVVYRESTPGSGTFDMVAVKLGPRAGEFYPLLEGGGLKADDRVATQGAFLVDAENRLNPGAGAEYFGASGGPSAGGAERKH